MPKHTPGPWTVEVHTDETTIESKYQTVAMDVSNCDADLIAAAPELLAALKQVHSDLQRYAPTSAGSILARAAIAKAEGR